jgi:hypothetical protein
MTTYSIAITVVHYAKLDAAATGLLYPFEPTALTPNITLSWLMLVVMEPLHA